MNRIGHDSSWNSATNPMRSPRVIAPLDTRQAPTASSNAIAIVGSASSAASNDARTTPARTRSSRSALAFSSRRWVSAYSRPRVFTTSAPSIDSCATALTSPMRSWARREGSSMRLAKMRFMIASDGNTTRPTSASTGSVTNRATRASSVSTITPIANGTGQNTSTAAFTSASMCASSSPVGVSRWKRNDSSR